LKFPILGLHHVTATAGEAQADVDFSAGALALRLVKKTVNFDNHNVYHFYYGNELGSPGTIWTTFPYHGMGVPRGTHGAGQIAVTSFSVPAGSLEFWRTRLRAGGLAVGEIAARFGDESLTVTDPSGLIMELIANDRDTRAPWLGSGVDAASAIRGLHGVTMMVRDPAPTVAFMRDVLGFETVNESEDRLRVAVNGDLPGRRIDIVHGRDLAPARNGLGTVHHVAMAIADEAEQLRVQAELVRRRVGVTEVMDRQYFKSIYFREPGGVLFEIATMAPGFAVDESPAELGRALKLPPWEEPYRAAIEKQLPQVHY
jgi:glyoxalase family protein